LASNAFELFDGNDLMIDSALAMGVKVDTSIPVDEDNFEYWQTVMQEYVSKKRTLLENIDKRIAKLKQRVEDINTELQIREVEGGAPRDWRRHVGTYHCQPRVGHESNQHGYLKDRKEICFGH